MAKREHGDRLLQICAEEGRTPSEFLDFSCNITPAPHSADLMQMLAAHQELIRSYPDSRYEALTALLAAYSGFERSLIIPGNGGIELLYLYSIYAGYRSPLIVAPTFSEYELFFRGRGIEPDFFICDESTDFVPDLEKLYTEAVRGHDLVVLCNPNNPTGVHSTREKLLPFIERLAAQKIRLLLDESFVEFTDQPSGLADYTSEYLFIVRSLTKFFGIPGLRLGYGCTGDHHLQKRIEEYRMPWSINCMAEQAAQYLLTNQTFIDESRRMVAEERLFLTEALRRIDGVYCYPAAANFILLRLTHGKTASQVADALRERRILVRNAANFTGLDPRFIRIAVKDHRSNVALLDALQEVVR